MKNYQGLYESKHQKIERDAQTNILKNTWLTNRIDLADLQVEMHEWMGHFEKYRPKGIITDNREANQVLVPDVQDWLVGFLFPKVVQLGLKKWAILVIDDLFAQVSVEQMLDDGKAVIKNADFTQSLFEDEAAAEKWLLK